VSDNPKYFEFEPFDMKTCNWEPKDFANVTGVTPGFAQQVKNLKGNGYRDIDSLIFKVESTSDVSKTLKQNINLIDQADRKD
jgi:hypothetical protein